MPPASVSASGPASAWVLELEPALMLVSVRATAAPWA
jgi:hypothetical protein